MIYLVAHLTSERWNTIEMVGQCMVHNNPDLYPYAGPENSCHDPGIANSTEYIPEEIFIPDAIPDTPAWTPAPPPPSL